MTGVVFPHKFNANGGKTQCGQQVNDNQYIAAVPSKYFTASNPHSDPICQQRIRVTNQANGRSVDVAIKERCGFCTGDDIDLSPVAYNRLGTGSANGIKVNWNFLLNPTQGTHI